MQRSNTATRHCTPSFMRLGIACLLVMGALGLGDERGIKAQGLPPCDERATHQDPPWVNLDWCLEVVINDESAGELAFSALAVGAGGTLYATRPFSGEVLAFRDTDGDALPDTPEVVISGLTLPNGLAWHEGALYISGGARLDRWQDGALTTLVDDLPAGGGLWTGRLTIGPDERLYVGVGAPCDLCEREALGRAALWSYALDGSDPRQVATGLREPADMAFLHGDLWTVDTAPGAATGGALDRLIRVEAGAFYGWPYCPALTSSPPAPAGIECASLPPPALAFPTHSHPIGMEAYTATTFPRIQNHLILVLRGSQGTAQLEGYTLVAVPVDEDGQAGAYRVLLPEPADPATNTVPLLRMHYVESGFWPRRPLDIAISPEGWLYISVQGGIIYALRPR
jgi:glucose/arabinose dehydrogenase